MAADWIKMRGNLWDDPRVARLCDITDQPEAMVIGALYWLWATADQHTEDGIMPGLTLRAIDRKTGLPGIAEALIVVGWLADHPEGIRIVNFEEHNGSSAKRRAVTARRVATHRINADDVTQEALQDEYKNDTCALAREREREEKEIIKRGEGLKREARASRLPDTWSPSQDDLAFLLQARPDLNAQETAARFVDYWRAQPGAKGRKLDWPATWRNWVRNEKPQARASPSQSKADRAKQWTDEITGRNRNEQSTFVIDIN